MAGSNGNLFFLNLKKYILNEPIDIRDLFFRMDGNFSYLVYGWFKNNNVKK